LPVVATKVVEATTGSDTTVNEVATLIEKDMALSAKLLQVINSPFYGFSRGITTINEAVSLIGFKLVANIALGLAAMSSLPRFESPGFDYDAFWERALASAVAAVMVTSRVRPEASHSIFTIALLQMSAAIYLFASSLSCTAMPRLLQTKIRFIWPPQNGKHSAPITQRSAPGWASTVTCLRTWWSRSDTITTWILMKNLHPM